jgi:uncharacterized protein YggE
MLHKFFAASLLAIVPFTVSASQLPEYPFIHVTGNAFTYAIPDRGELDFDIVAADADPAVARATVEARVDEIQALMEEQGQATDAVQVRDVRQNIRKAGDAAAGAATYEVKCTVHLEVHDLTKWRAVTGGLLAKQNLDNFSTNFGASDRDKIEMDLTNEAIKDARKRAEAMAAGFGRKLGPVTGVTPGGLKNLTNAMGLMPASFPARSNTSSATRVERGDIVNIVNLKFAQSVDLIFRIK